VNYKQKWLVQGAGWLGIPLIRALQQSGYEAHAGSRNAMQFRQHYPDIPVIGLNPDLKQLPDLEAYDGLIAAFPPGVKQDGPLAYAGRMGRLGSTLATNARFVMLSSTGVYADAAGTYAETDGVKDDHPVRLAEKALLETRSGALILRLGGLTASDRLIGRYFSERELSDPDAPVNFIHREDAVAACIYLILQQAIGIFNVVAPEHPTKSDVYSADLAALGLPPFINAEESKKAVARIISSEKLQAAGYAFLHLNPLNFPR
jgi:hypothetical protein